jgi:hypothetical protein
MSPTQEDFEKKFKGVGDERLNPFFMKSDVERFLPQVLDNAYKYYLLYNSLLPNSYSITRELFKWHRTDSRDHLAKLLYYKIDPNTKDMGGIVLFENVKLNNICLTDDQVSTFSKGGKRKDSWDIPWFHYQTNDEHCREYISCLKKEDYENSKEFYETLLNCNIQENQNNEYWQMTLGTTEEGYVLFPIVYKDTEGKRNEMIEFLLAEQEAIKVSE